MPKFKSAKSAFLSKKFLSVMLLAAMVAIAGCGNKDRNQDDRRTAAELYAVAKDSLDRNNWARAVRDYRLLQTRYPFGRYTEQSMLDLAYAYYKSDQAEGALSTLDRFIRTYPAHENVDYAFYLKGLVNYDQNLGLLEKMMPERVRDRDQTALRNAFLDFKELLRRYPNSRYAGDARQRMIFLRNSMAAYEVSVAEYYMRREAYIAVTNRARYVVENYPETPQNGDALMLLHKAYLALNMPELADDSLAVLELNFPDHYYVLGKKKPRTWRERLWPFD